jgi:hypothetical protein
VCWRYNYQYPLPPWPYQNLQLSLRNCLKPERYVQQDHDGCTKNKRKLLIKNIRGRRVLITPQTCFLQGKGVLIITQTCFLKFSYNHEREEIKRIAFLFTVFITL